MLFELEVVSKVVASCTVPPDDVTDQLNLQREQGRAQH